MATFFREFSIDSTLAQISSARTPDGMPGPSHKKAHGARAVTNPFALPKPITGPGRQGQGLAAQRGRTAALTLTTGLSRKNQANDPFI